MAIGKAHMNQEMRNPEPKRNHHEDHCTFLKQSSTHWQHFAEKAKEVVKQQERAKGLLNAPQSASDGSWCDPDAVQPERPNSGNQFRRMS
jgi:hypothetical protein